MRCFLPQLVLSPAIRSMISNYQSSLLYSNCMISDYYCSSCHKQKNIQILWIFMLKLWFIC